MRPASVALLAALACCAAPPSTVAPAAPAQAPAAPSASSSSAFGPVPEPPPPPRLRVPAPYAVVARAGAPLQLRLFPAPSGAFIAVVPPPGASVQFASIEGDQARLRPELGAGLPAVPTSGSMDVADISRGAGGALWAQLERSDEDGIRSEFWRLEGRWSLVGSAAPGETGLRFSMVTRGEQTLALGHGAITMTPFFVPIEPARPGKLLRFTKNPQHPQGCPSKMTFVVGFRFFAGGEALAVGFSCASSFLQIERWSAGSEVSEAREVREVSLQESTSVDILSPDEFLLHLATPSAGPLGALTRARLKRRGGVWQVKNEGPSPLSSDEAEESAASEALRKEDGVVSLQWRAEGIPYFLVTFPSQGPPIEHVIIRKSPVQTAVEWRP